MVALLNVGTVGSLVNGQDTTPLDVSTNDAYVNGVDEISNSPGSFVGYTLGKDEIPPLSTPNHSNCGGNACNLSGITDTFAAAMDSFSTSWSAGVYKNGHSAPAGSLNLDASYFTSVTNLTQLIAVLDTQMELATGGVGVGGGGVVYHSAGTITIVSNFLSNLGPTTLIALVGTPGEKTTVQYTGLTDAEAASLDRFTLSLDGAPIDTSGIDFATITTRAQLATALDGLTGIDVTQSTADGGTLTITASTVGDISFTNMSLVDITQQSTSGTASFGYTTGEGGITALNAAVAAAEDFRIFLAGSEVHFSLSAGSFTDAASLTAALDAHSSVSAELIDDATGAFIKLTSVAKGAAQVFTALELIDNEAGPPTKASTTITGVDASAAEVDSFTISIDGAAIDTSGVDFDLVTDGATLATELNKLSGIDVAYSAASGGTLTITKTTPGAAVFSNVTLQKFNELVGNNNANNLTGDPSGTLIIGLGGNDILTGSSGQDKLVGGGDHDFLDGRGGADEMIGGTGNDTFVVDDAGDIVTENANEGSDTVRTTLNSFTLGTNVENLVYKGGGSFTGNGNGLANLIQGGDNADTLNGNQGNDTLEGGEGNDILNGGAGDDTYSNVQAGDTINENAGEGVDTVQTNESFFALMAGVENLVFSGGGNFEGRGNGKANTITGGDSNDTLIGRGGNDTLIGGRGNDIYKDVEAGDTITELAGEGIDQVRTNLNSFTLMDEVEKLRFTGTGDFEGRGNGLNNRIVGNGGNDILDGRAGNDILIGGLGNDTYKNVQSGDTITEKAGEGSDTVRTNLNSFTLMAEVENLTFTGSGAFNGVGNGLDNRIAGAAGNDLLDGRGGADTMIGGVGDDIYIADQAGDRIIERAGEGDDTVRATASTFVLTAEIENLVFTGAGGFDGRGNGLDNRINGGAGNDSLDGKGGNDILIGGLGNDTYRNVEAGDTITENAGEGTDTVRTDLTNFTLMAHVERLTFTGAGAFNGVGNDLDNRIVGGDGNDTLDGRAGNDELIGGLGDDTYVANQAGDTVTENLGEGMDTIRTTLATLTLPAHVENLVFAGTGAFDGTGNDLANRISGGDSNDTLRGGGGNDTLIGKLGDDTVLGGVGNDTLRGEAGADELSGQDGDDTLLGGDDGDILKGGDGNDTLRGQDGADTLRGGLHDDFLDGGAGNDVLKGENGKDTLQGNVGADRLQGGTGGDVLNGGDGEDQLFGEVGNDTLTGGADADRFYFDTGKDRITDFEDDIDTVKLDVTALGLTGMSKADVLALGQVSGADLVFDFGNNNKLWIEGFTDIAAFGNDLSLI